MFTWLWIACATERPLGAAASLGDTAGCPDAGISLVEASEAAPLLEGLPGRFLGTFWRAGSPEGVELNLEVGRADVIQEVGPSLDCPVERRVRFVASLDSEQGMVLDFAGDLLLLDPQQAQFEVVVPVRPSFGLEAPGGVDRLQVVGVSRAAGWSGELFWVGEVAPFGRFEVEP